MQVVKIQVDLQECIESSMFYNNEYRLFNEFTYQGMEINLFPENNNH